MSDVWDDAYKRYMSSALWKKKRLGFIEENYNEDETRSNGDASRRYKCDRCGWNWRKDGVEAHHKRYSPRFFGKEIREDIMVVCKGCHKPADAIRAKEGRERSQAAWEQAGYEGWLYAVYGDDYAFYYDSPQAQDAYERFVERQEYR